MPKLFAVANAVQENSSVELRRSKRYQLRAPAFVWWERPDGRLQEAAGTTRDIGTGGVFIFSDVGLLPGTRDVGLLPGTRVELDIHFTPPAGANSIVQLHGEGRVTRIERDEKAGRGFAAEVVFYTEAWRDPTGRSRNELQ